MITLYYIIILERFDFIINISYHSEVSTTTAAATDNDGENIPTVPIPIFINDFGEKHIPSRYLIILYVRHAFTRLRPCKTTCPYYYIY